MGATAAAIGEFLTSDAAVTAAVAGTAGASAAKLLTPKQQLPELRPVTAMPDPLEQQKAKERSIVEQMARRGRSASILTQPAGTTLGGG